MPKVNPWDVVKYIIQGVSEDFTRKKALAGVGKWNDMVTETTKKKKKPGTPDRMSLSPRRAVDIKRKVRETQEAGKY